MSTMQKDCQQCGTVFSKPTWCSLKNWERRRTCSKTCFKALYLNKKGRPAPKSAFKKGQRSSLKTEFKKGHATWAKGKVRPFGDPWNLGKSHEAVKAEKNKNWKGDAVGYEAVHRWMLKWHLWPKQCQACSSQGRMTLANVSKRYTREPSDWIILCYRCHWYFDRPDSWTSKKFALLSAEARDFITSFNR